MAEDPELEETQLQQARALVADQSRADMILQAREIEIQHLHSMIATQSRSTAPQPEEAAVSNLPDDGIDGWAEMDPDFDPVDIANVALRDDAETPLGKASEEDPDLNDRGTQEPPMKNAGWTVRKSGMNIITQRWQRKG